MSDQPAQKLQPNQSTAMLLAPSIYIWVEYKGPGLYRAAAHADKVEVAASMGDTRENAINHLLTRLVQNTARLRELEKTHTHLAGSSC